MGPWTTRLGAPHSSGLLLAQHDLKGTVAFAGRSERFHVL